ncbi:hypothetical protein GJ496_006747 [Pomphorhynchus laevis]|nr:hypothetical protein GJ496_006747 [Pomphorhynchus laevis]
MPLLASMSFLPESLLKCEMPVNASIDLYTAMCEFDLLGLKFSKQWCSDMLLACRDPLDELPTSPDLKEAFGSELKVYLRAKSLFDLEEYERVSFLLQDTTSKGCLLLNYYAQYLLLSKKSMMRSFEKVASSMDSQYSKFISLRNQLQKTLCDDDFYTCFIRACVARCLKLNKEAIEYFIKAVTFQPHLWSAWIELATLVSSRYQLKYLKLPNHWVRNLFFAHCLNELQCSEDALLIYDELIKAKFEPTCSYIQEKRVSALWNAKGSAGSEVAKEAYLNLRKTDPYNLDFIDQFSNLLFVIYDRPALSLLAQQCFAVNPYRHETCCVLGNYYSIIKEHCKAVHYYLQALKVNPYYVFAWTLAGHECMELKSYSSAVLAYRKAVELDSKEYRAWYGLGQTYEIMKMPKYALYYYMKAHEIRPLDARFLVALGDVYSKIGSNSDSRRCYWKAYCVGDCENIALTRLATIYRILGNDEAVVRIYLRYLEDVKSCVASSDQDEICEALRYLGQYYERHDDLTGLEAVLRWALDATKYPNHSATISPVISQLTAVTTNELRHVDS